MCSERVDIDPSSNWVSIANSPVFFRHLTRTMVPQLSYIVFEKVIAYCLHRQLAAILTFLHKYVCSKSEVLSVFMLSVNHELHDRDDNVTTIILLLLSEKGLYTSSSLIIHL